MPTIITDDKVASQEASAIWLPPEFPKDGRLPAVPGLVGRNHYKQESMERAYYDKLCLAAGKRVVRPCTKTLHISLFFDGTGNNLHHDFYVAKPPHPTNIARLFRATVGSGSAGGVPNSQNLFDDDPYVARTYFKFYMPGVGTSFPEIDDLDYSLSGQAAGNCGEERINWALLRIIDALKYSLTEKWLTNTENRAALKKMATYWSPIDFTGHNNRAAEIKRQLKLLEPQLYWALNQCSAGQVRLLGIKLYVYGFSRGAAAARAFISWLSALLPKVADEDDQNKLTAEHCLAVGDLKIPLSVEFLGLMDTVASVGVPHLLPIAEGHMAWADGTLALPDEKIYGNFVKHCVHFTAAHEQRLCFPLDSIRRKTGKYPQNSIEVLYPGVHSDIGGGYPPGEQGKAIEENDSLLLSQIALHDMYAAAFQAGAPLKVPPASLPQNMLAHRWMRMPDRLQRDFAVNILLVKRFNAWRELTLNLPPSEQPIGALEAANYQPVRAHCTLEQALAEQIHWLTAWRIHRYAQGSMMKTPFYLRATNSHMVLENRDKAQAEHKAKREKIEWLRREQRASQPHEEKDELVLVPGLPDFEPDLHQSQLKEAAQEFATDYSRGMRWPVKPLELVLDHIPRNAIFLLNGENEAKEYIEMQQAGEALVDTLFPYRDETRDADELSGLVRALFDDQVHDSRAWFLHATIGAREIWSSYFRYRMIYFDTTSNKPLSLLTVAGVVIGVASIANGVVLMCHATGRDKILEFTGMLDMLELEVEALDLVTRLPLELLPEAEQLRAFSTEPGEVVAQQRKVLAAQRQAKAQSTLKRLFARLHANTNASQGGEQENANAPE